MSEWERVRVWVDVERECVHWIGGVFVCIPPRRMLRSRWRMSTKGMLSALLGRLCARVGEKWVFLAMVGCGGGLLNVVFCTVSFPSL